MTDESHLEAGLGTALRAYADDLHPDLDALTTRSRIAGARIRRHRRIGGSLAAAAAVAGVIGAASLGGVVGDHADDSPGLATQPSAPALAAGQRIDLGHGRIGTVHRCRTTPLGSNACIMRGVTAPAMTFNRKGVGSGFGLVVTGPVPKRGLAQANLVDRIGRRFPGIALVMPQAHALAGTSTPPAIYRGPHVTVHLAGWRQVGPVADDKQSLTGPHGAVADIVWRPAADHDAWVSDPDKGNTPGVWTSAVHDGVFVSIQGGLGTTDADIAALGASLTWN